MVPLLPVAIALIIGILLYGAVGEVWLAVIPAFISIILFYIRRIYPAILALCVMAGFLISAAHTPARLDIHAENINMRWSGVVSEHREYEGAQMMVIRLDSCLGAPCATLNVKCIVPSMHPAADEGDRLLFTAAISPMTFTPDLPGQYDYDAPLRRMGVGYETVINPDSIIRITSEGGLLHSIRRIRRNVQQLIATSPIRQETGSFLTAALTGDRTWLSTDTHELFSTTGIAHILALSGMHVAILTLLLTILLMPFTATGSGRYRRMCIIICALWIFAVMTGLSPSVVRAVIMATLFAGCTMLQRVWSPLNALSAAAMLILVVAPYQVYTLGFMLTFIAVASIIIFAGRINPFDHRHRVLRNISGYICVTIAAMLGTGALCAYSFHIFPVYFIITNIAVSLLLPPMLGCGVILIILKAIGWHAVWLGAVTDCLYGLMTRIAAAISILPGASVSDIWMPEWSVAAYFLTLIFFGLWLYRRRPVYMYATGAVALCAVIIIVTGRDSTPRHEAYITRSATETTMLIRDDNNLYVHTTAGKGRTGDILTRDARRYKSYMLSRGIKDMTLLTSDTITASVSRTDNMVTACGRCFVFISDARHAHAYRPKIHYAVVCRGFRGDIVKLAATVKADTILLSRDLNLRRHDRYVSELSAANFPHRSLRDNALHLTAE